MDNKTDKLSKAQTAGRILLGIFLVFAGTGHLSFQRKEFSAQVPEWLPMQPDMVVFLSGGVEIFLGAGLLFLPRHRASIGWIVALFLVAVFPGNIAQLINHKDAFGLNSDLLRWIRLPSQPLLIVLVLWSTGAWSTWRNNAV
ncbi:putative membrane protein [Pedobacter sp. CG_S7]|uniref:DoxX family protein n=1 Tax=Pedobacter sp. CG_S7 TaxID=3143930 RepID=UPI003394A40F